MALSIYTYIFMEKIFLKNKLTTNWRCRNRLGPMGQPKQPEKMCEMG